MTIVRAMLVSAAILCSGVGWATEARQPIQWVATDWPPVHIVAGDEKHKGVSDQIILYLQRRMPEYEHQWSVTNFLGAWALIKRGEPVCYASALMTPERQKFAHFSMPVLIAMSNSVVMRKAVASELGVSDSVSLSSLLKNKHVTGGVVADRAYGKGIDDVIADSRGEGALYSQRGSNQGISLFRMVLEKRLDYMIEYPWVAAYFEHLMKRQGETVSIQIAEAAPYAFAHVACPKNEWGRTVIGKINRVLAEGRPTREYREIVELWQGEQGKARIRKIYDEVFLKTGPHKE